MVGEPEDYDIFLSFLRIIRDLYYPGKYICQPIRIIRSLLYQEIKSPVLRGEIIMLKH